MDTVPAVSDDADEGLCDHRLGPNWYPAKSRTRQVLRMLWCFGFDWTDIAGCNLGTRTRFRRWLHDWLMLVWFRAHNGRIFNWLDEEYPKHLGPPSWWLTTASQSTWTFSTMTGGTDARP